MEEQIYDLLIIGAGPIGIATAIEAQKANLNYLVIEKGCLVNSLYHYPTNMHFFSTSEKLEIDEIPFVSINNKPTKQEALEYYRRIVISRNLNIHLFEKVEKITKNANSYTIFTSKTQFSAKNIVISTGFYDIPNLLNIPGENLPKVFHYYQDPHYFAGQNIAIIGASNSAVDAALEIYRKGGKVSLIIRKNEISEHVKYWVRPDIENRIKEGSIKVFYESKVISITSKTIEIIDKSMNKTLLENDFVLAMTGYRPNFQFLHEIGISLANDALKIPVYNPETMESNQKGIYLAGVVCGGMETHKWFIENSRIHAKLIVQNIQKEK